MAGRPRGAGLGPGAGDGPAGAGDPGRRRGRLRHGRGTDPVGSAGRTRPRWHPHPGARRDAGRGRPLRGERARAGRGRRPGPLDRPRHRHPDPCPCPSRERDAVRLRPVRVAPEGRPPRRCERLLRAAGRRGVLLRTGLPRLARRLAPGRRTVCRAGPRRRDGRQRLRSAPGTVRRRPARLRARRRRPRRSAVLLERRFAARLRCLRSAGTAAPGRRRHHVRRTGRPGRRSCRVGDIPDRASPRGRTARFTRSRCPVPSGLGAGPGNNGPDPLLGPGDGTGRGPRRPAHRSGRHGRRAHTGGTDGR